MNNLRKRIQDASRKLGLLTKIIIQEGKGQSLIVIVFAFLGLLAFVGLAVDLGLVYVERVQLGRACDAAALAGAQELPLEKEAAARALEYLALNGYDVYDPTNRVELEYNGYTDTLPEDSPPSKEDAWTFIQINTTAYEDKGLPPSQRPDSASRIAITGTQKVGMNFMQFFGFRSVAVSGFALAENINDLDISVVFDRSGSMEFDTYCYGCWTPISGQSYPTGTRTYLSFPYDYTAYDPDDGPWPPPSGICSDTIYSREQYDGNWYKQIVIEAEYYSYNHSLWDRDYAVKGLAHWTLQRNTQAYSLEYNGGEGGPVGSSSIDSYGGYMKVTPYYYSTYDEGAVAYGDINANTPRLDYDFHTPSGSGTEGGTGNYYIYLRAQGGYNQSGYDVDPRTVHWGLGGVPQGSVTVSNYGIAYDGARSDSWTNANGWKRIGPVTLSGNQDYTLNLWAGGLGFAVDKIIITKDPNCTSFGHACRENGWLGPDQTQGRTRDACDECDPRYGLRVYEGATLVCDNTGDDLWDDEQPIRAAKEAVKRFISRLNPDFDQVAYVHYSSPDSTEVGSHLYCKKKLATLCSNYEQVLDAIEATRATGNTSMGDGMRLGIYTLRTDFTLDECKYDDKPCGRARSAHIMVLMTDGVANDYMPDYYNSARSSYGAAAFDALWPPTSYSEDKEDQAKDYVIYQAIQARDNGIVIYAISLGVGADFALMAEIADISSGEYFHAPDTDALDGIFDSIFERIFLRLIS